MTVLRHAFSCCLSQLQYIREGKGEKIYNINFAEATDEMKLRIPKILCHIRRENLIFYDI